MSTEHPITPPPELVRHWLNDFHSPSPGMAPGESTLYIATQASRWGADAELEACCKALEDIWDRTYHDMTIADILHELRSMRRPKPPSLAEQALEACERSAFGIPGDRDIIRRALERLQELESNG